jgi:hypothetical protein
MTTLIFSARCFNFYDDFTYTVRTMQGAFPGGDWRWNPTKHVLGMRPMGGTAVDAAAEVQKAYEAYLAKLAVVDEG